MSLTTQFVQALGGLLCATATAGIGVITPEVKKLIKSHTTAKNATIANDYIDEINVWLLSKNIWSNRKS